MALYLSAFYGDDTHYTSTNYLSVNNCGYYKDISGSVGTHRYSGLSDYQLLYTLSGSMEHMINGESIISMPGDIFIYRPHVPQVYKNAYPDDSTISYAWVHFSGYAVEEVLGQAGFGSSILYHAEANNSITLLIRSMIEELRHKRQANSIKATSLLLDIIVFLSRELKTDSSSQKKYAKLLPALREIENTPIIKRTNAEYAAMCGVDTYYFIHLFNEVTGMSPLKYISDLSMHKAAGLVAETNLDINEISQIFGFEDTCYFSRKFKKHFNMSPSEYRKKHS